MADFEQDVELIAEATIKHHITATTDADGNNACSCGRWWDSADGPDWDEHMAEVALAALSSANRLVPPGSEVREKPSANDYLAAARAALAADPEIPTTTAEMGDNFAADAGLRAAVDSAFAAGQRGRGEVLREGIRFDLHWCPWHDMLDSEGDECGWRTDQELWPVKVVTWVVREQP